MPKHALIVYGGWEGHQPRPVAEFFCDLLAGAGIEAELCDTLDVFTNQRKLMELSLIVPHWTMGKISPEQCAAVSRAVESGVGLAGVHGGMCDAFRESTDWQFLTGGQWVAHPGNQLRYRVDVKQTGHPITQGIPSFEVETEQYYMHVDPAVQVLATTRFPTADGPHAVNGPVDMPVIWTKRWGGGRIYYNALGHTASVLEREPVRTLVRRGFEWAAKADHAAPDPTPSA